jgi:hypothetical protein
LNKIIGKCNGKKKWKGYALTSNEDAVDEVDANE